MKTIRVFEEGDIITSLRYNQVAVRHALEKWALTISAEDLSDDEVEDRLDTGDWAYVGNRKDMVK